MNLKTIIIGSRGSELALWQAHHVQAQLVAIGVTATIQIIKTQGDQIQHLSFDKLEGKGFFTKELEEALLSGSVGLAVHSHKDLPTTSPEGLMIAAVSEREDPSELLLMQPSAVDTMQKLNLKIGAIVGTSSARRKSQLLALRNDVNIEELRGNVPTRVQKLRDGKYDAIIIAKAGIERLKLNLEGLHVEVLDKTEFVPPPAQGVLALQIREADVELHTLLQKLNSTAVAKTIALERKVLNLFDGGCQLPLGVYCQPHGNGLKLWATKANAWNAPPIRLYKEYETLASIDVAKEAQAIVSQINNTKGNSVFITKDLGSDSFFVRNLQAHGFSVHCQSLINTTAITFSDIPKTDWIFFSSASAVKHFFTQAPVVSSAIKYAVIGKGTETALKQEGKIANFVGDSLYISKVGRSFEEIVGNSSVLFPQAKDSLQSVQKELSFTTKVHNLYVYATTYKAHVAIPPANILVFTSPSNLRAYLEQGHKIVTSQKVIAIGQSTARELEQAGIKNYTLPYASDEVGLTTAVFTVNSNQ